jgi:hypothetical protein
MSHDAIKFNIVHQRFRSGSIAAWATFLDRYMSNQSKVI